MTEKRAYLQAELDRAKAEMKELDSKLTPIEKMLAKQSATRNAFVPSYFAGRVRARLRAGQKPTEAWADVLKAIREQAEEAYTALVTAEAKPAEVTVEPATEQDAS